MALDNIPVGKAIGDYCFQNPLAPTDGTPISQANLETIWENIMGFIYNDMKVNMQVAHGTYEVTVPSGGGTVAVTGLGGPAV